MPIYSPMMLAQKNIDKVSIQLLATLCLMVVLAGCTAAQPSNINNACTIFDENGGWFNNWYKASRKAEKRYGVPIPTLLATLHQESSFQARAKPPRGKLLGFIPWRRPSSAYGYPQALDSTWADYQKRSGNKRAKRNNFADSVDFVGWYYARAHQINGIALNDTYHLYLTYYFGYSGYKRGIWRQRVGMQRVARRVANRAARYRQQMLNCGYRP